MPVPAPWQKPPVHAQNISCVYSPTIQHTRGARSPIEPAKARLSKTLPERLAQNTGVRGRPLRSASDVANQPVRAEPGPVSRGATDQGLQQHGLGARLQRRSSNGLPPVRSSVCAASKNHLARHTCRQTSSRTVTCASPVPPIQRRVFGSSRPIGPRRQAAICSVSARDWW